MASDPRAGRACGVLVLRIDRRQGGEDALGRLPEVPRTVQAHDGAGRRVRFFAYPPEEQVRRGTAHFGQGIEVNAEGVDVIAPSM